VEAGVSVVLGKVPLDLVLSAAAICPTWFSKFLMLTP
ncbi:hypothetical protein A2U01_0070067, partial [Trifolium medium]|nr:hypothetical protein [Trifolium medium]